MGRHSYSDKTEADHLKKIEISWLKKHGFLEDWKSGTISWTYNVTGDQSSIGIEVSALANEPFARLHYTQTENNGEQQKFDYKIPLTTSPCPLGGERYWFLCPFFRSGEYCGQRVGVLYKNGDYFACRHCNNLTYSSKNENRKYKMFPLFSVMTLEKKIEDLQAKIKRPYYAGKPTKKQRRLEKLYDQASAKYRKYPSSPLEMLI
ncbi:MAG: hypothetical protein WCJ29_02100 [bacterium]